MGGGKIAGFFHHPLVLVHIMEDFQEWFKEEDKNGDGVIDLTEMIASKKEKKKEVEI